MAADFTQNSQHVSSSGMSQESSQSPSMEIGPSDGTSEGGGGVNGEGGSGDGVSGEGGGCGGGDVPPSEDPDFVLVASYRGSSSSHSIKDSDSQSQGSESSNALGESKMTE